MATIDPFNPVGSAINDTNRRNRITDYLTNYHFHVMDVSFSTPTVFSLGFGFRFCSAPEIQADVKEFKEGNFEYPRKVISGAKVSDVSFHRGTQFFDSDFSDWMALAVKGGNQGLSLGGIAPSPSYRKNLLVIQYSDVSTGIAGDGSFSFLNFQSITQLVTLIPARAWMLYDCVPTVYKSSNDFDALGADISVAELTVAPRFIDEFNCGV